MRDDSAQPHDAIARRSPIAARGVALVIEDVHSTSSRSLLNSADACDSQQQVQRTRSTTRRVRITDYAGVRWATAFLWSGAVPRVYARDDFYVAGALELLIPPTSVAVGLLIGRYTEILGERKRWQRDQVARAFAEFTGAADALLAEVSVEPTRMSFERVHDSFVRMTQAGSLVDTFGSPDAARSAQKLWNIANEWLDDWDGLVALTGAAWDKQSAAYRNQLLEVTNAGRQQRGDTGRIVLSYSTSPTKPAPKARPATKRK